MNKLNIPKHRYDQEPPTAEEILRHDARMDMNAYQGGHYLPKIIEARLTRTLGKVTDSNLLRSAFHEVLSMSEWLHDKEKGSGSLTEADFYKLNVEVKRFSDRLACRETCRLCKGIR